MSQPRITNYDNAVAEIEIAVKECMADFGDDMAISEDEMWVDMAASILVDADEAVAREVCRCTIGYIPQSLESLWAARR